MGPNDDELFDDNIQSLEDNQYNEYIDNNDYKDDEIYDEDGIDDISEEE